MHKCHMVIDLQFGSTGKGALAGYLAKREDYDTVVCSFSTNAGHTYIDAERGLNVMTQQLPTGITSPTVKNVLIGPGALICPTTLMQEIQRYKHLLAGKNLMIHPHAAIVAPWHAAAERQGHLSKIGSTTKGVSEAMIARIRRNPEDLNTAEVMLAKTDLAPYVVTAGEYRRAMEAAESILVEGAQGFSLSMYHGFYPYTTSRDVTPWQIAADCGLPFKWAPYVQVLGTMRTFPIRVNNRDGTSGPGYSDQLELDWGSWPGMEPEKTTVTKLQRRIFTFSAEQTEQALWHCGQYWKTQIFLNFANYCQSREEVQHIVDQIENHTSLVMNPPRVEWVGYGPDDADIVTWSR